MISLLFMFLAGICNSIMDVLSFRYEISVFNKFNNKWFNPSISWKNKWKNDNPLEGEKFLGSSTIFVLFTDAWHFFKSLMILFISIAIIFYKPVINIYIDILLMHIMFLGTFELFWSKILVKKK